MEIFSGMIKVGSFVDSVFFFFFFVKNETYRRFIIFRDKRGRRQRPINASNYRRR